MTDSDLVARVLNRVLPKVQAVDMVGIGLGVGVDWEFGEAVGVVSELRFCSSSCCCWGWSENTDLKKSMWIWRREL